MKGYNFKGVFVLSCVILHVSRNSYLRHQKGGIVQRLDTKTNTCVKFHDYTMSSFSGVVSRTKHLTE